MKQKDLALIIFAIFMSAIISIFVSKLFISSPKNRQQQVEVVTPITKDFNTPTSDNFNENSIDPTQLIQIGKNKSTAPFNNNNQ